jgi:hypothetical protein
LQPIAQLTPSVPGILVRVKDYRKAFDSRIQADGHLFQKTLNPGVEILRRAFGLMDFKRRGIDTMRLTNMPDDMLVILSLNQ